jgi:GxxExxY protein
MTENELSKIIVDACIKIHTKLGPGLLESVYEVILARELRKRGLTVERQVPVSIEWEGEVFDDDLIVNDLVIIELKSVEQTAKVHKKQLLTYLKLTGKRLGLLANFGAELMKDGLSRVVNGLQ